MKEREQVHPNQINVKLAELHRREKDAIWQRAAYKRQHRAGAVAAPMANSRQRHSIGGGGISSNSSAAVQQRRRQLTLGKILLGSNWVVDCCTIWISGFWSERTTGRFVSLLWHPFANLLLKREVSFRMEKAWKCRHWSMAYVHEVVIDRSNCKRSNHRHYGRTPAQTQNMRAIRKEGKNEWRSKVGL